MYPTNQLLQANTSINLQSLSPKQLLGECLQLSTDMLKQIIEAYIHSNHLESPFVLKPDLSQFVNYILDPTRMDKILAQFVTEDEKNTRPLARSWLFQLRSLRNTWAHSHNEFITLRIVNRAFDTVSLLYLTFKGDQASALFQKIEFYRRKLLIVTAQGYAMAN